MLLGGGFAGLAGMMEVNGAVGQINATFTTGYGYTAIIVAFLGRLIGIFFLLEKLLKPSRFFLLTL